MTWLYNHLFRHYTNKVLHIPQFVFELIEAELSPMERVWDMSHFLSQHNHKILCDYKDSSKKIYFKVDPDMYFGDYYEDPYG